MDKTTFEEARRLAEEISEINKEINGIKTSNFMKFGNGGNIITIVSGKLGYEEAKWALIEALAKHKTQLEAKFNNL